MLLTKDLQKGRVVVMNRNNFGKLYSKIIIPIANDICSNIEGAFLSLQEFQSDDYSVENFGFNQLYTEYQKQKSLFRIMCDKNIYDENAENLLDRHKVCAALCIAVIKCNVIFFESKGIDDSNVNFGVMSKLNEQLAIAVSLTLLKNFLIYESKNKKDVESKKFFPEDNFSFPHPQDTNETYADAIVRTLFFANLMGQLNLFLVAHILFLVEQYHFCATVEKS